MYTVLFMYILNDRGKVDTYFIPNFIMIYIAITPTRISNNVLNKTTVAKIINTSKHNHDV